MRTTRPSWVAFLGLVLATAGCGESPLATPDHAVLDPVSGRQDEDVGLAAEFPQLPEDGQAVHARQHQVEDDHAVVVEAPPSSARSRTSSTPKARSAGRTTEAA